MVIISIFTLLKMAYVQLRLMKNGGRKKLVGISMARYYFLTFTNLLGNFLTIPVSIGNLV